MSQLDRRQLLRRGAAATAVAWVAPVVTPLGVAPAAAASGVVMSSGTWVGSAGSPGWTNEPILGPNAVTSLCLTATSIVGGVAFMFGIDRNPGSTASWNSIDAGFWILKSGATANLYTIRPGSWSFVSSLSIPSELCVEHTPTNRFSWTVNGVEVRNVAAPAGPYYLDSSALGHATTYGGTLNYDLAVTEA